MNMNAQKGTERELGLSCLDLCEKLSKDIKDGIICGKLPSIAELSHMYRLSHNTVKKALDRLKEQDLVHGWQGKGVFVNEKAVSNPAFHKNIVFYLHSETYQNHFFFSAFSLLRRLLEKRHSMVHLVNSHAQLCELANIANVVVCSIAERDEIAKLVGLIDSSKIIFLNVPAEGFLGIGTDNLAGGYMAIEYLYRHGHRRIGILSRDLSIEGCCFIRRYQGCLQFAAEHRDVQLLNSEIAIDQDLPVEKAARTAAAKLTDPSVGITAVFAFTDIIALGALSHFHDAGLPVPGRLSLLGFDNRDFAPCTFPPLTSLQEPLEKMVQVAMELIDGLTKGSCSGESLTLKPFVVERGSVGYNEHNQM